MADPVADAILGAVRERLVASTDLQVYVGVDGTTSDPSAARVYLKWAVDAAVAVYPAVTLYLERAKLDVTMPRMWNPGFVLLSFYSNLDPQEAITMYEICSRLLHAQRWALALNTLNVCVKEVVERDVRGPVWVEATHCWRRDALYRIRASVSD